MIPKEKTKEIFDLLEKNQERVFKIEKSLEDFTGDYAYIPTINKEVENAILLMWKELYNDQPKDNCDMTWLEWHMYENEFGANKLKANIDEKEYVITSNEDMANFLEDWQLFYNSNSKTDTNQVLNDQENKEVCNGVNTKVKDLTNKNTKDLAIEIIYNESGDEAIAFKQIDASTLKKTTTIDANGNKKTVWVQYGNNPALQRELQESQILYFENSLPEEKDFIDYVNQTISKIKILDSTAIYKFGLENSLKYYQNEEAKYGDLSLSLEKKIAIVKEGSAGRSLIVITNSLDNHFLNNILTEYPNVLTKICFLITDYQCNKENIKHLFDVTNVEKKTYESLDEMNNTTCRLKKILNCF